MADILGEALGAFIPKQAAAQTASSSMFYITIFIIILLFLVIGGVGVFLIIRSLQYNKKIEIYEETNGIPYLIGRDRAKEIKYNIYGDSIFILRKRKQILPRGELKSGKNLYFYFISEDGTWVNYQQKNINTKLKEADVKFIHPDMRAFKSGTALILKNRYDKPNPMEKWGPIIVPLIFFVVVGIAFWFIADRLVAVSSSNVAAIKTSGEVMDKAKEVLSGISNVCSTSGYRGG